MRSAKHTNIDLRESVVYSLLLVATCKSLFEERKEQLQSIAGFNFLDKLIDGNCFWVDGLEEILDDFLITVHIEKTADNSWSTGWVDLLNVDLNRLELLVLVEV